MPPNPQPPTPDPLKPDATPSPQPPIDSAAFVQASQPPPKKRPTKILVVSVLILVLIAASAYALLRGNSANSNNSPSNSNSEGSPSSTTNNSSIDLMLKGVDYKLLDSTFGSACSDKRDVCYSGETVFLKMEYPVPDTFKKIVVNLDQNKWLFDDGDPAGSFLESDTIATSDSQPNNTPDKDLLFTEPGADKDYGYYSYLNPGFFGTHETLYRGNEGAYFFAFSNSEVQTNESPYYILESELSVGNSYDFGRLLSKLDDNSFILSITVGEK